VMSVLLDQLLPAICSIAGDMFVFQQDSAPAHRACDNGTSCLRSAIFHCPRPVASEQS